MILLARPPIYMKKVSNVKKTTISIKRSAAAFSLIEVTLAVGIAGFCLIVILGLLPTGVKVNQDATQRTSANGILSMVVANTRAIPKSDTSTKENKRYFPSIGSTNYVYFSNVGSNDDGDKPEQAASDSIFQVAITNVSPASLTTNRATLLNITVSWPYHGSNNSFAGSVETLLSLDRDGSY